MAARETSGEVEPGARPKRLVLFFGIVLVGLVADLVTKHLAFEAVPDARAERITVIDGFFYIAHVRNPGAMWSLFQDVPAWAWILLRGAVFCALLGYYLRQKLVHPVLETAFALVLAGALGNLHDNLFALHGQVRDFILWVFWGWPFPVFNLADSMISVGATLLFLHLLLADLASARRRRHA